MSATATARRLVMHLLGCDVTDVVLAPGSRSGPLARALAAADDQGRLRLHVRIDEREAAFLALGMAKVTGRLTPVVTTSGTAVANLHPAMLEALHSRVPLSAITADRPARLRGTGANQTTAQPGIFPGVRTVSRVEQLRYLDGFPTHLNLELEEPLTEPVAWDFDRAPVSTGSTGCAAAENPVGRSPVVARVPTTLVPGPRTVVIAGDRSSRRARQAAEAGNWPLIAEPSSGSRTGPALTSGRLLLGRSDLVDRVERVVSFGHTTLGRGATSLLSRELQIVHVGDQTTFPVPAHAGVAFVDDVEVVGTDDASWLADWQAADASVCEAIGGIVDDAGPEADPLRVARSVWSSVPPGGLLVVGPSNPIRDLDLLAWPYPIGERRKVVANRGLAGIDGVVSTAIGAALGRPSPRSVAYVGDLTFLHGSNGLLIGPGEPRPDLTIVVANDDGGSIFATLEQGAPEFASTFERVFGTPTSADLAALCASVGVEHVRVPAAELDGPLGEPAAGLRVVEVPITRDARRALAAAIADACALRP